MARAGDFLIAFFFGLMVFFSRLSAFFTQTHSLHTARFAALHQMSELIIPDLDPTSLLLGVSHFKNLLRVRPTAPTRELGNLLVVAPTRGGKGLLATSQLLTWRHSVIVNDIKGDLYTQTAGYRATLARSMSSATQLLYQPHEGDGQIFTQRAIVMLTQLFLAARQEGYPPFRMSASSSGKAYPR